MKARMILIALSAVAALAIFQWRSTPTKNITEAATAAADVKPAAETPAKTATKPVRKRIPDADVPPPEEGVYEVNPGERPGYLWAEGYWGWNGRKHVWQSGRWIKEREGYLWVADTWALRGKKWHLYRGHWEKEESEYPDAETANSLVEISDEPTKLKKTTRLRHHKEPDYSKWGMQKKH